jgi:hypothetical protein
VTYWYIYGSPTTDKIRNLTLDNKSSNQLIVYVRGTGAGGVLEVASLDSRVSTGPVVVAELLVTGNLGNTWAPVIQTAEVGGNANGTISIISTSNFANVYLQSLTVFGNLLGSVTVGTGNSGANSGTLGLLQVFGSIGTASSPVTITAPGRIENISASAIHANITVDPNVSGGGGLGRIETTSGDLTGSLTFRVFSNQAGQGTISPGIFVNGGNLDANVTATSTVSSIAQVSVATSGKKLAAGKTIRINGSLQGPLSFPNDGLSGQIIINANNTGGTWTADVKENNVALTPPNYAASAASLGGGAVGLVPFYMHATDSEPDDGASFIYPNFPNIVKIAYYGPVEIGTLAPVTIERQEYGVFPVPAWESVDASKFTYAVGGTNNRELQITPGVLWFQYGYDYRVRPVTGRLLCRDIPSNGSEASVFADEYNVRLQAVVGDLNLSQAIEMDDAMIWIDEPVDVNQDQSVDSADLEYILDRL